MHLIIYISSLLLISNPGDERAVQNYIERYGPVAVAEMHRVGIPASIKLAQAIVESRYGTSGLSVNSNNHFGIKCKEYWKGQTYYHEDDDYNDKGHLIKSCFRSYEVVVDSYIDHSNFLSGSIAYEPLFKIAPANYEAWAWGLQHLGYASDRGYAQKLINTIESYELYHWDRL